jgi:hypothetical protein
VPPPATSIARSAGGEPTSVQHVLDRSLLVNATLAIKVASMPRVASSTTCVAVRERPSRQT